MVGEPVEAHNNMAGASVREQERAWSWRRRFGLNFEDEFRGTRDGKRTAKKHLRAAEEGHLEVCLAGQPARLPDPGNN
jgi:hypothetical protein